MSENLYLLALALIDQEGKRFMPLGGKSISKFIDPSSNPGTAGEGLASDLLLRVFQKSESGRLRRSNGDQSLLLIQLPMELMQERIPIIKAQWINTGDNEKLMAELQIVCNGIWSAVFNREDGLNFSKVT